MKAQVFRGVNQLSYEDVPIPTLDADEVLVEVEVVGLGREDLARIRYPLYSPPRIFGHQIAGKIAAVGDLVEDWSLGQRVAVMPHVPCFRCHYCLSGKFSLCKTYQDITTTSGFIPSGGGFAQYVKVPGHMVRNGGLIDVPERVSLEPASFLYPVNCCLKAIKKAKVSAGQIIFVAGAGPRGLLAILLLKYFGVRSVVVDCHPHRLDKALQVGAEAAFLASDRDLHTKVNYLSSGLGVDGSLLSISNELTYSQALDCTRKGGKILVFSEFSDYSITINPNLLYRREIDLLGSHGADFQLQSQAIDILFNQRIDVELLISDRYPLEDLPKAVDRIAKVVPDTYKILLYPQDVR
ncbi:alcohol dehydrogenase catalytic domain-containing protein [Oscillatoriales cyanobacterium LEGE 11467]|uniref:Alcohol dehydrogenase catalytic domain-containing protein n=2 Tax=Zarconia TaxID=2992130 RepID=A0A928VTW9_9CYAN|nr:alcohol dehydrogenase catalytic domain-containing protein [Zarconia navalis LEGE 11467]